MAVPTGTSCPARRRMNPRAVLSPGGRSDASPTLAVPKQEETSPGARPRSPPRGRGPPRSPPHGRGPPGLRRRPRLQPPAAPASADRPRRRGRWEAERGGAERERERDRASAEPRGGPGPAPLRFPAGLRVRMRLLPAAAEAGKRLAPR